MKKIILTGGGTAGHVTPNIALLPRLKELGYEISYIGSYSGIEKGLIEKEGIPYYGISSGNMYFGIIVHSLDIAYIGKPDIDIPVLRLHRNLSPAAACRCTPEPHLFPDLVQRSLETRP